MRNVRHKERKEQNKYHVEGKRMIRAKLAVFALILSVFLQSSFSFAALITFDNLLAGSIYPPGFETEGFVFTHSTDVYISSGADFCSPDCPENGSNYLLLQQNGGPVTITQKNGGLFSLYSFEAAETFVIFAEFPTIEVSGLTAQGQPVYASFDLDQINDGSGPLADFESFTLPSSFRNLLSAEFKGTRNTIPLNIRGFSLDNIEAIPVPEVGSIYLLLFAGIGLFAASKKYRS
jgi:hypothetical protein